MPAQGPEFKKLKSQAQCGHQWTKIDGSPQTLQAWQATFPVPAQVGQIRLLLRPKHAGQVTTFRPSHSGQTEFLLMGTMF